MKTKLPLLLCCLVAWAMADEEPGKTQRLAWFQNARLGIFIHWGIYAVNGIDESWSFYNGYIPYDEYMKQAAGFTASRYDPETWAQLIATSGARYAVLTSKHHDGMALWPTQANDLHVVKRTPAARDLLKPYCEAMRRHDLKVGLYFSHLDWSHPDYPFFTRTEKRYENDPQRWSRFLAFREKQIEELARAYHPDLLWFDGDWDFDAERWQSEALRKKINSWLPQVIVNARINGFGDYETPEQGVPITRPVAPYWELCMTMNDSWGYQGNDRNYKTPLQILQILVDCISMGGNLLLDIGPRADGTIPEEQQAILKEVGRWTHKHQEAVYGTLPGIPKDYFYGSTALSQDRQILYLFLDAAPKGPLFIKGLKNRVNRVWVVGNGTRLSSQVLMKQYWSALPGIVYITVPEEVMDPAITVVAVLLEGPIELHK